MTSARLTRCQVRNRTTLVAALRSGRYRKGRDALYAKGSYCCLGVAEAEGLAVHSTLGSETLDPASASIHLGLFNGTSLAVDGGSLVTLNDDGATPWMLDAEVTPTRPWVRLTFTDIAFGIELDTLMRQDGAL